MPDYQFVVQDIFRFRDGRTVFVGVADGGPGYIARGLFDILVDGEVRGTLPIEGEMIADRSPDRGGPRLRSISSTEEHCLDRKFLEGREFVLRPVDPSKVTRGLVMHRHLLGLDSPPPQYVADPMTQGPILPEDWDGDAWVDPKGRGYFLRAWHKPSGRVAYGAGPSYDEARRALLEDVADGVRRVEISTPEIRVG